MTADLDKIEKVVRTIAEARAWGIEVMVPDINERPDFTVVYQQTRGPGPRGPGKHRARPVATAHPRGPRRVKGVGDSRPRDGHRGARRPGPS
jgi:DNA polymerase-3 subunit alpha